jgi:hypothetical protein
MKCKGCSMKYVGQTGRTFNTRYKEHIYDIKSNNINTGYSRHIVDTWHTYGAMEDTMDVVGIGRKGQYLNTLEKYYIRKISREQLHMNDTNIYECNPTFDELQRIYDAPTCHTSHPSHQHSHETYKYRRYRTIRTCEPCTPRRQSNDKQENT